MHTILGVLTNILRTTAASALLYTSTLFLLFRHILWLCCRTITINCFLMGLQSSQLDCSCRRRRSYISSINYQNEHPKSLRHLPRYTPKVYLFTAAASYLLLYINTNTSSLHCLCIYYVCSGSVVCANQLSFINIDDILFPSLLFIVVVVVVIVVVYTYFVDDQSVR